MNVPKAWVKILCLVMVLGQIDANIDNKEYFCGKKLVRTLTELCSIYNNPTFARNRFRRQIVDECCRSQCSRRYLVQYYCLEANSAIVNLLKAKPANSSKTAHEKSLPELPQLPPSLEERNKLPVGSLEDPSTNKKTPLPSNHDRITNGKRTCKCRKRRAKRIKKRRLQAAKTQNPVPRANIGHVEHSQRPFYVWRFSSVY